MTGFGSTQEQYEKFMKEGGDIVFEIDATDISKNREFESFDSIKPKLDTGFELPPTTMIHVADFLAAIRIHGDEWSNILVTIYLCGGKVVYKRISTDKYQAHCSVPQQA